MRLDSYSEVKRLTSEMVAIPSINKEPDGESAVAQYVYDYFAGLDYFKEHPDYIKKSKPRMTLSQGTQPMLLSKEQRVNPIRL